MVKRATLSAGLLALVACSDAPPPLDDAALEAEIRSRVQPLAVAAAAPGASLADLEADLVALAALAEQSTDPTGDVAMDAVLVAAVLRLQLGDVDGARRAGDRVMNRATNPKKRLEAARFLVDIATQLQDLPALGELAQRVEDPELVARIERLQRHQPLRVGAPAPAFSAVTTAGDEISLADLSGSVVLLDFWATWCGPCVADWPELAAIEERYREQGFRLVSISLDHETTAVERFLSQRQPAWPQVIDGPDGSIVSAYGVETLPATFLIDGRGRLLARGLRVDELPQHLDRLVGSD